MPTDNKQPGKFVFPAGVQNGLCAAVAAAMAEDYRINRFPFYGFPGVSAEPVVNGVQVWICLDRHKAGPLYFKESQAIAIANEFTTHGTYRRAFFEQVQRLLIDLEELFSKDRDEAQLGAVR